MSRRLLWLLAAVLAIAGIAVAVFGLADNEAAPLPEQTWTVKDPTPEVSPAPVDDGDKKVTADTMAANRILIPSLGVYAKVVSRGISAGGELNLPPAADVGLYDDGGPLDSETGTVLIAGHVSSYGSPGALKWLSRLKPGARFYITDRDRLRTDWVTTGMQTFLKADLPPDLFDADGPRRAALVTCGGTVVTRADGSRHFNENVVAYGAQVGSTQIEG